MDSQIQTIYASLPQLLLPWFADNKRDLPWRHTRDPYHIWLSEIMLQQTRVEAVKGYYRRFLEALPSIRALAQADDSLLQKLWEGLGYYSRVRNLKKAAQRIMDIHGGEFPTTYSQVLALPGIGEYTAGAICSIVYNAPTPAVDGNVLRVISRLTNDASPVDLPAYKKAVNARLKEIYPGRAGDFTQALMELGATVCGPNRKPDCANCPCRKLCLGYRWGTAEQLPVKQPKKERRQEDRTVFILECNGMYALEKREEAGLLAGLWQFPNLPGRLDTHDALKAVEALGLQPRELLLQTDKKHIFTHIQWNMRGYYIQLTKPAGNFHWLSANQITADAALPTAFRQFWDENIFDRRL